MIEEKLRPQPVDDVRLAFPANLDGLLPPWHTIPEAFRRCDAETKKWHDLASSLFYKGATRDPKLLLNEGITSEMASRHLACVLRSYQPKHEHKMAGVAWLMSLWFRFES